MRSTEAAQENPKPFVWVNTADEILASIKRVCLRTSETGSSLKGACVRTRHARANTSAQWSSVGVQAPLSR